MEKKRYFRKTVCYTMLAVLLAWALFYFQDLTQLGSFLKRLFTVTPTSIQGMHLIL